MTDDSRPDSERLFKPGPARDRLDALAREQLGVDMTSRSSVTKFAYPDPRSPEQRASDEIDAELWSSIGSRLAEAARVLDAHVLAELALPEPVESSATAGAKLSTGYREPDPVVVAPLERLHAEFRRITNQVIHHPDDEAAILVALERLHLTHVVELIPSDHCPAGTLYVVDINALRTTHGPDSITLTGNRTPIPLARLTDA